MAADDLVLFAFGTGRAYGEAIAAKLGLSLAALEERNFEDGEHKARPLVSVRRRDVFVVASLYGEPNHSVNDKLCRLLFFLGTLKESGAEHVTAIVPYLCYARKDRKTKFRDPVTMRYVAQLFEAVSVDRVVTMDVHNLAAYQNAFRCRSEHLEARMRFVAYFEPLLRDTDVIVVAPDEGGFKRADSFRRALGTALGRELPLGFMEKRRSAGVVSGEGLFAEVKDRTVIVIDDLVSSGTTLLRVAEASRKKGARRVYAAATHGLFSSKAAQVLADPALDQVVVTDTVPPFRIDPELVRRKLVVIDAATLFADAIQRLHEGGSITGLLGPED